MRIDKWLWAARFFKTRALAAKACDLRRVRMHDIEAKPAREVRAGDMLQVKTEGGEYEVEVLGLSEMRGPAAVAQNSLPGNRSQQGGARPRGGRAPGFA